MIEPSIQAYYDLGMERDRLTGKTPDLERVRTQELLERYLPPPPAAILDVGGGAGIYAAWLARAGYRVRLIDPIPLHVEQAAAAACDQPGQEFAAALGDARHLAVADGAMDAVLLLGPLYHLTERGDRLQALAEARRVVRPGGRVVVAAVSRFASLLDGLRAGFCLDPTFAAQTVRTLRDGQHRNPDPARYPRWFTTAYFHHPDELADEVRAAGISLDALLGVEGPGGLIDGAWADPARREAVLEAARLVEREPALLGASAHILAIGHRLA